MRKQPDSQYKLDGWILNSVVIETAKPVEQIEKELLLAP